MSEIKSKLNQYALIYIKYRIGNKSQFFRKFSFLKYKILDYSWTESKKIILSNLQTNPNEIIEDARFYTKSHFEQNRVALQKAKTYEELNKEQIFNFLESKYEKSTIEEENIERRLRHILANQYLAELFSDIHVLHEKKVIQTNKILKPFKLSVYFIKNNKFKFIAICFLMFYFSNNIIEAFTSPNDLVIKYINNKYPSYNSSKIDLNTLANYIHKRSIFKYNGSVCNDGSISKSQGRGTCSWHGGVYYYFYRGDYEKSYEECVIEATNILENFREKALKKSLID